MLKLLSDRMLGTVFCGWLVVFWISFWLGTPVPQVVGNRPVAAFPGWVSGGFSSDWQQKLAAWGLGHSPFRLRVIKERNRILVKTAAALDPLPISPGNGEVAAGCNGWLFLLEEAPDDQSAKKLQKMAEDAVKIAHAVTASGRRFFLVPIPNKSSVYPDYEGTLMRWSENRPLRDQGRVLLDQAFQNAPDLPAAYLPLWQIYAQERQSRQLFLEHDTHWNANRMLVAVHQVLERVQPGVWDSKAVVADGQSLKHGDLMSGYLLQSDATLHADYRIAKPEPEKVEAFFVNGFADISRYRSSAPGTVKGKTLVIIDSFVGGAIYLWAPWFEDVTFAHFSATGSQELADRISQCDTLVFTSVERLFRWRMGVWAKGRYDYLTEALAKHPRQAGN